MGQDDGCGILRQRALDHLAGVDAGSVDSAVEQHLEGQHPVFGIKEETGKELVRLVSQTRLEIVTHCLRAFQR